MSKEKKSRGTRRGFLKGVGAAAAGLPLAGSTAAAPATPVPEKAFVRPVTLRVNGATYKLEVECRRTLADVLRKDLGLTGTKVVCDRASCGACTVLLDGRAVFSCHLLAVQASGKSIETIENLSSGLDPIQVAFLEHDAYQCGFCTPGMIMALKGGLGRVKNPVREEIGEAISGNLCRCGAYDHILKAALSAAAKLSKA